MCIQCLQVCYSVLYSIFSYNNFLWVLTLLLSCCSLLWYGIKPQCISVVQFQKMWFRVDFLISQSFLFYYFPCCVKKKYMVNCSKRFPGSTCLLYPYRSLLFPLSPLPFSCSILILLPAVPPECGACLRRKSWQVCFESSAPAPSDLSRDFLSSFLLFR